MIGVDAVPPLGFSKQPSIVVDHSDISGTNPTASTCDLKLTLPVGLHGTYERFRDSVAFAMLNCHGFGRI